MVVSLLRIEDKFKAACVDIYTNTHANIENTP